MDAPVCDLLSNRTRYAPGEKIVWLYQQLEESPQPDYLLSRMKLRCYSKAGTTPGMQRVEEAHWLIVGLRRRILQRGLPAMTALSMPSPGENQPVISGGLDAALATRGASFYLLAA